MLPDGEFPQTEPAEAASMDLLLEFPDFAEFPTVEAARQLFAMLDLVVRSELAATLTHMTVGYLSTAAWATQSEAVARTCRAVGVALR